MVFFFSKETIILCRAIINYQENKYIFQHEWISFKAWALIPPLGYLFVPLSANNEYWKLEWKILFSYFEN